MDDDKTTFRVAYNKDLSIKWYVYFKHPKTGRTIKKYGDINNYHTFQARKNEAYRLIRELKKNPAYNGPHLDQRIYQFLEQWKSVYRKKTYQTMKSKVDIFFRWVGRRKVTNALVKEFFLHIMDTRHSTTYNTYFLKLRYLFGKVGREDLMEGIGRAKEHRDPARYFQKYQIEQLKAVISERNPELWLFVQFIYYCFIRPGELRHLKAGDFLFDDYKIRIRNKIAKKRKRAIRCNS